METRITTVDSSDRYSRNKVLGTLSKKQYEALEAVVRLSPGYSFEVNRYAGGPSSKATHVLVWKDGEDNYVGLVGKESVQYYDKDKTTEAVVKRVAHRVYRMSGLQFS